jgi:hypothetical protein
MRYQLTAILLLINSARVLGQYDTYSMNEQAAIDSNGANNLYLNFNNLNYLRNHEYFNKIWDGYTLFGTQLNPQLSYYPNARLRIDGGVWINKEFGREKIKVQPTFSVKWNSEKGKNIFLFGNILGNINHNFLDPIYDYERLITFRNEYGSQWLHHSKYLQHDLFIHWDNMIQRGDTFQESFVAGYTAKIMLLKKSSFQLSVPVQAYLNHRGGQINITNKNLITLANSAMGLSLAKKKKEPAKSFINEWRIEGYYVTYKDLSPNKDQLYKDGDALMGNFLLKTRTGIDIMLTYWRSNQFMSALGNPLYQNVSSIGQAYFPEYRELLFIRFIWDKKLFDHFYAHFRLEPYYSIDESMFEYSYSLFISYRQNFLLKKNVK